MCANRNYLCMCTLLPMMLQWIFACAFSKVFEQVLLSNFYEIVPMCTKSYWIIYDFSNETELLKEIDREWWIWVWNANGNFVGSASSWEKFLRKILWNGTYQNWCLHMNLLVVIIWSAGYEGKVDFHLIDCIFENFKFLWLFKFFYSHWTS